MRGWAMMVVGSACISPPPASLGLESAVIFAEARACDIYAADEPVALSLASDLAALDVVVAATHPDGIETVLTKLRLGIAEQRFLVPPTALRLGDNAITVWSREANAEPFVYHVHVVNAVAPNASAADGDGDCYSVRLGDCNDQNAAVHPGAEEVCGDAIDNDCNGKGDVLEPLCAGTCPDADNDGAKEVSCGGSDCDDGDALRRPGAAETCNAVDDDCDGLVDESFDLDLDGFTSCPGATRTTSGAACPEGFSACSDCDDGDPELYPGTHGSTSGSCGNGILDAGEECDDSNATAGDGCSSSCVVECPVAGATATIKDPVTHTCYWLFAPADPSDFDLYFGNGAEMCDSLVSGGRGRLAVLSQSAAFVTAQLGAALFSNGAFSSSYLVWVGGGDHAVEGTWRWNDGALVTGAWAASEPSNSSVTDDCLSLRKDQTLASQDCLSRSIYGGVLCEITAVVPQCSGGP